MLPSSALFRVQPFLALIALMALAIWPSQSHATCSALSVVEELTCPSKVSGKIAKTEASELGGSCTTSDCYSCGTPFSNLPQTGAEDIYSFECQTTGDVTLLVSGMNCDLDMYILSAPCDGCTLGEDEVRPYLAALSISLAPESMVLAPFSAAPGGPTLSRVKRSEPGTRGAAAEAKPARQLSPA
jgi:hypothetical protein